jgi:hypothetical protein
MMVSLTFLLSCITSPTQTQSYTVTRIATNLLNPRGIAVLPDGRLIVAQAGTGFRSDDSMDNTGKLSILEDRNGDEDGKETTIVGEVYRITIAE